MGCVFMVELRNGTFATLRFKKLEPDLLILLEFFLSRCNMDKERIKNELATCTEAQLGAIKGILEFNLRGLFIGCVEEVAEKLKLVEREIDRRKK